MPSPRVSKTRPLTKALLILAFILAFVVATGCMWRGCKASETFVNLPKYHEIEGKDFGAEDINQALPGQPQRYMTGIYKPSDCAARCNEKSDCAGFITNKAANQCYLKYEKAFIDGGAAKSGSPNTDRVTYMKLDTYKKYKRMMK